MKKKDVCVCGWVARWHNRWALNGNGHLISNTYMYNSEEVGHDFSGMQ